MVVTKGKWVHNVWLSLLRELRLNDILCLWLLLLCHVNIDHRSITCTIMYLSCHTYTHTHTHSYHLECITPPLDDVPTGNWYCIECIPIINSQYVDHFSESEQDLSLSLDTIPTSASDSDVIMRMGHRNDYGSGSEVIITGIEQIQESDSDVTVIGMRHLRQQDRRKMAIMIEESTSELSVTGESSDEEILAMKLRRTLQREANRASRIPLIRESSTTSSTCSSGSKFDLDESTTVLVTRESEHDNSFIDVVGDTDGEGSNDDDFIEIDSVVCGSVADNDPLSGAHTRSTTQGMSDRKVDRHSRHTVSGKMASHDVCKTDSNIRTKLKWGHSVQSPRSSRNKDDQPSLSRSSSYSKRRLVFDSEKSTKHRLENSPNRESKGHKLRNREAGRFDCRADKVSDRGKEAVSKNRRELASKKRLHHHRGAEEENTHSTSSLEFERTHIKPVSLELKTNVKKRKSNPLSILDDDGSSCQSGYVDESPPTDVGLLSVSTNQNQTHTTVQCKQNRAAANVDRPQKEAGISSSYREDILVQRKDLKGANRDNPALDKSCKSSSRIEDSRTRVSQRSIIPRRKKCRRVVLNPPKRQSSRRRSPPRSKQQKRKGFNRRKRRNTRSTILNRRRSNDSNYYPPRNMSMDGPSRPEWTPRTTRALARTAATHHSAMREAVRASYRYDSQEVGLKYAREILAQQRQVTPWKSTLSFTPSQSCLEEGANTPLSGFSDRTLTPSVGASCSPLSSETPKRLRNERRERLDQYKGSPGSLSLFLRREVRVSRAQRKSARNSSSESSNQPRNDYYGWSDDTSPLSVSHSINSRVFQDRIVSINDQEERESYGRESPTRQIVHVDSKKRHLSEVLVTPVKVRIRENPVVESDNEGGETDLLSQLCQNLNDLQNKRNVIQRDGSIVPLRESTLDMYCTAVEQCVHVHVYLMFICRH